jgi:hypothetical protein
VVAVTNSGEESGHIIEGEHMNAAQKQRILDVIARDAEIRFNYVNKEGQFCVIGGLADEIGVSRKRLEYGFKQVVTVVTFAGELRTAYGLTTNQLRQLQRANDKHESRQLRQESLARVVDQFYVNDEPVTA